MADTYRLSGDGVGPVPTTSTRADLERLARIVRDTVELGDEAIPESVSVLAIGGDTIRAVIDSGRVYRLEVHSPRFRTADSIGVGTPLGRLLEEPDVYALGGEGQVYVQVPRRCGMSFRLASAGELGDVWDSLGVAQLRRLPPETPVSDVLVFGCRPLAPAAPE